MGLGAWFSRFRKRRDAAALQRAEDMKLESSTEREISRGDIEGREADVRASRSFGEPSIQEAERLGDDE